jgi:DNA polymerase-3 subunit gamma/tau
MIEIDAASNTSVEDVRDLRDKINFSPNQGRYKVYIIDEVHMLSTAAFNALLKTLEEPPAHAIFILATTEIHKIPATVLSRCQRHEFRRVPVDDIVAQLQHIVAAENLNAEADALTLIARSSAGGLRDAISLLDQLASSGGPVTLGLTRVVLGTATSQAVLTLVDAIAGHLPADGLNAVHAALDAGTDPRVLARQVVDYLRALLLIQLGNSAQVDLGTDTRRQAEEHARTFSPQDVLRMIKLFNGAAVDLRGGWQPSLPLELALAEVVDSPASVQEPRRRVEAVRQAEEPRPRAEPTLAGAASPSSPAGAAEEGGITLEQVTKAWKKIKLAIKKSSPGLEALLNSGRVLDLKDNLLILGFGSDLLRSMVETEEQLGIIRQSLADAFGRDLQVKCVVSSEKQAAPADVKSDGMVAAALKVGGKIVDIQE